MDWNSVDEGLIKRGELLLSLEFLERYDEELKAMNRGKEGRPFTLTCSHVVFLAVVRYLFGFPYRQLEGFTRALKQLLPRLPATDYSGVRRRILGIDLSPFETLERGDSLLHLQTNLRRVLHGKNHEKHHKRTCYNMLINQ